MLSIYLSFYLPIYLPYLEVGDYIWYSIKAFKVFDIIRGTLYNKFTNKLSFSLWYFWFDSNAMQPDCASVPKTTPTDLLRLGHRLTKVLCKEKSSAFSSPSSHHIITILIIISSSHFSCSNNTPDYNWISSGLFLFWNGGSARFQMKSGVMRCIVQFVFVLDFVFEFIVVSLRLSSGFSA